MPSFDFLKGRASGGSGHHDVDRGTLWTTPWLWRDTDGVYVARNGEAWLYRRIPIDPLVWEDPDVRLQRGQPLEDLLRELGALSTSPTMGLSMMADEREIHILSVTWEEEGVTIQAATPALAEFQEACLDFALPRKVLALGVRLKTGGLRAMGQRGVLTQLRERAERTLGEQVPDRAAWEDDYRTIDTILRRHGATVLDRTELAQMESWFNNGRGPEVLIQVTPDHLVIDDTDTVEMAYVRSFANQMMESPGSQWMLDAMSHQYGPHAVSVRGYLQTAAAARARARSGLRRRRAQMEEERLTGDLERIEDTMTYQQAQQIEGIIAVNQEPIITRCSIVLAARRTADATETYVDELRGLHGIEVSPMIMRQLDALDECLPCSTKRINPALHDVFIPMLAYCGLQGWSNLGDSSGLLLGVTDPDYTTCLLDPLAAPRESQPPATAIFGDPGSGKTFACQLIATQATLAGHQVIYINPKVGDTLASMARQPGVNGSVVKLTQLESGGGFFDPFYVTEPLMAAEMASSFILGVLGGFGVADAGFTQSQELKLSAGLRRGAAAGARCVTEALAYVDDEEVRRMVEEQAEASTLFSLAIGREPRDRYHAARGLTLIEFDRKLDFPERGKAASSYSRSERIALAVMRLITRASLEILMGSGGGVLIVDEAWTFLSHPEGLAALQQIGREGRSMNILPIFATQRVDDLVREGINMESYISRALVMSLREERDITAALTLIGLDPTPERSRWIRQAGPKGTPGSPGFRPAMALHRDLRGRHSALYIGPVTPDTAEAFSTTPDVSRARDARYAAQNENAPTIFGAPTVFGAPPPPPETSSPPGPDTPPAPPPATESLDDVFGS